ncbi:MAG: hypothetical protein WBZ51_15845, partial [Xanthobacteraceae bacterium]
MIEPRNDEFELRTILDDPAQSQGHGSKGQDVVPAILLDHAAKLGSTNWFHSVYTAHAASSPDWLRTQRPCLENPNMVTHGLRL